MKRLLIIHRALAPYRIELFNWLFKQFDCKIYFEYGKPFEQTFKEDFLKERMKFEYDILPSGFAGIANLRLSLPSILRREKPDIIMCSELNLITAILLLFKRMNGNPPLIAMCDDNLSIAQHMLNHKKVNRYLLSSIDGMIGCDTRAIKLISDRLGNSPKMHYLPIVQDDRYIRLRMQSQLDRATKIRESHDIKSEDKCILFVGRLAEEKNLEYLIAQFGKLAQDEHHVHLMIVGEGALGEKLRHQSEQLTSSGRIHFVGKKEGDELYAYYAAGDMFVLPSKRDAFAAVVNEALIAGLPCIVSDIAGSVSMLNEHNGLSIDINKEDDLLHKMQKLLKSLTQPFSSSSLKPSLMPKTFDQYMIDLEQFINSLVQE